jgi:hypothetical protein
VASLVFFDRPWRLCATFHNELSSAAGTKRTSQDLVTIRPASGLTPFRRRSVADLTAPAFELPGMIERVLRKKFLGRIQSIDAETRTHGHLILRRVSYECVMHVPGWLRCRQTVAKRATKPPITSPKSGRACARVTCAGQVEQSIIRSISAL